MKKVSFRVRRIYFDQIVSGKKREEIRGYTPYWRKILIGETQPEVAVFVCGRDVHHRWIKRIYVDDPEKVLGRSLSEQGKLDITTRVAIITELGAEKMRRIQRKGLFDYSWKNDPKAVYIGRPSPWGNPFKVSDYGLEEALTKYKNYLLNKLDSDPGFLEPLRGKNLVCWCPLDQPCHGDLIIKILSGGSKKEG